MDYFTCIDHKRHFMLFKLIRAIIKHTIKTGFKNNLVLSLAFDQEFERDRDLVHDETFEQLIFTIHKLKFTLVIIQSGATLSPPVATIHKPPPRLEESVVP